MKAAYRPGYRPRFECGRDGCGHLSTRHQPTAGGGRCTFRGCECNRIVVPITAREFQVLKLIAGGGGLKGAAQKLELSPKTIEAHLVNMRAKTGLGHVNDLVLGALRAGLLTLDDLPQPNGILSVQLSKAAA